MSKYKVLVIDVEMTCWDEPRPNHYPEIIQVGVVEVDMINLEITRERMMYVKPVASEISDFCTELTGVTKHQVYKQGLTIRKMIDVLYDKFGMKNKVVFGWGRDDIPFDGHIPQYVNLSALYSMMKGEDVKYNLEDALKLEDIEFEGNAHDALVDAQNTAKLLILVFKSMRTMGL